MASSTKWDYPKQNSANSPTPASSMLSIFAVLDILFDAANLRAIPTAFYPFSLESSSPSCAYCQRCARRTSGVHSRQNYGTGPNGTGGLGSLVFFGFSTQLHLVQLLLVAQSV